MDLSSINKFGRGALDSLTFGSDDEMKAALGSYLSNGNLSQFDPLLKAYQAEKNSQTGLPYTLGGIAGFGLLPSPTKYPMLLNSLYGGLYGYGSTDGNVSDRSIGAGVGLGLGAAFTKFSKFIENKLGKNATKPEYINQLGILSQEKIKNALSIADKFKREENVIPGKIKYVNPNDLPSPGNLNGEYYMGKFNNPDTIDISHAFAGSDKGKGNLVDKLTGFIVNEGNYQPNHLSVSGIIEDNTLKGINNGIPISDLVWSKILNKTANNLDAKLGDIDVIPGMGSPLEMAKKAGVNLTDYKAVRNFIDNNAEQPWIKNMPLDELYAGMTLKAPLVHNNPLQPRELQMLDFVSKNKEVLKHKIPQVQWINNSNKLIEFINNKHPDLYNHI